MNKTMNTQCPLSPVLYVFLYGMAPFPWSYSIHKSLYLFVTIFWFPQTETPPSPKNTLKPGLNNKFWSHVCRVVENRSENIIYTQNLLIRGLGYLAARSKTRLSSAFQRRDVLKKVISLADKIQSMQCTGCSEKK